VVPIAAGSWGTAVGAEPSSRIVKVYTKEAKAAKTQQPANLNAEVAEQRGEREMFEQNFNLSAMSGRLRPKAGDDQSKGTLKGSRLPLSETISG